MEESSAPSDSVVREFEGEEFDNDFLAEIDALVKQADLDSIPVHFYTPGCQTIPMERMPPRVGVTCVVEWFNLCLGGRNPGFSAQPLIPVFPFSIRLQVRVQKRATRLSP